MRKSLFIVVFIFSIISINFGCNENTTQEINAQDYIMPLAVNNLWIARVQKIDTNGNVISTYYDTVRIIKDTTIYGVLWYMCNDQESLLRNNGWGLSTGDAFSRDWERQFLKYPANIGQRWELDTIRLTNAQTGEPDTVRYGVELAAIDTSITVPEGSYNCYYYKPYSQKLDGSSSDVIVPLVGWHWYSPGKGPIKFIYYDFEDTTGNIKEVWELIYRELN